MFISFEYGGDDVTCPKCKSKYKVTWSTEYGDPLPGFHSKRCLNLECTAIISFDCDVVTTYTQPDLPE